MMEEWNNGKLDLSLFITHRSNIPLSQYSNLYQLCFAKAIQKNMRLLGLGEGSGEICE